MEKVKVKVNLRLILNYTFFEYFFFHDFQHFVLNQYFMFLKYFDLKN